MKFYILALTFVVTSVTAFAQQVGYGGDGKQSSDYLGSALTRNYEALPSAATTALAGAGAGSVDNGAHLVKVTCYTGAGETSGGTASNSTTVADKTVNGKIAISSIPTCSSFATGRKVYMTTAGGTSYFLLSNGTIANNTATTLTANDSDATLSASTAMPTSNTMLNTVVSYAGEGVAKLFMPLTTSSSTGIIYKGGQTFIHNFKSLTGSSAVPDGHNIFIGLGTGNFTMGSTATNTAHGSYNIGIGDSLLTTITRGNANIAIGYGNLAVGTTFASNIAVGINTLYQTTGDNNVAIGGSAGYDLLAGGTNTLIGLNTGRGLTSGAKNTIIGANVTGLSGSLSNNIILADGDGNIRLQFDNNGVGSFGKSTAFANVPVTATSGGTTTLDLSAGNIRSITMPAGNTTIALSNVVAGNFTFIVTQDSVGSRTITWPSNIKDGASTLAVQPTTAANSVTVYDFISDGTNLYLKSVR